MISKMNLGILESLRRIKLFNRTRSESITDDYAPNKCNPDAISEFTFAREGYSVHSISSYASSETIFIACGSRTGGVKVINGITGEITVENSFLTSVNVLFIQFMNNTYLFSCGGQCSIPYWEIKERGECRYISSLVRHTGDVRAIDTMYVSTVRNGVLEPGYAYLTSCANDNKVIVWRALNRSGGDPLWEVVSVLIGHLQRVVHAKMMIINDRLTVVSGDDDGRVIVWDALSGSIIFQIRLSSCVLSLATSSTLRGRRCIIIAGDVHGSLTAIDMSQLSILYTIKNPHYKELIRSTAIFDEYDEKLLIGGCDDGGIMFWSLSTGKYLYRLQGHRSWVSCLHITEGPNNLLISGGCDSKVKIWNLMKIYRNIKYSRRRDFLMFLSSCGFCRPSSLKENVQRMNLPLYMNEVFTNQDICFSIARFI